MKIQSKDSAFTDDVKPKIKHLPLPSPTPQPLAEELVRKMQFEQQQLFYIYNYRSICNELTSKSGKLSAENVRAFLFKTYSSVIFIQTVEISLELICISI